MVLCTDVTEERRLQREVVEKDAEHKRAIQAMRTLLAGGGQQLVNVLRRSALRIEESRATLQKATLSRADIEEIFQRVHTVKGEARVFEQTELTSAAARLEDELSSLRSKIGASGIESAVAWQSLEPKFREVQAALRTCEELLVEASPIGAAVLDQVTVRRQDLEQLQAARLEMNPQVSALVSRLASRPFGEMLFNLPGAVVRWAEELDKRVALDVQGRETLIPPELSGVLSGAVTHLVRNAVAHGIERPSERHKAGKPAVGVITLAASALANGVRIVMGDDGQGAEPERFGLGVPYGGDEVFEPGMTTAGSAQRDADLAGHGMGLAAVRSDLARVGYRVRVTNRPGLGFEIQIEPDGG